MEKKAPKKTPTQLRNIRLRATPGGYGISPRKLMACTKLKPIDKVVMQCLFNILNGETNIVAPGLNRLAKAAGIGKTKAGEILHMFESLGFIKKVREGDFGITNAYTFQWAELYTFLELSPLTDLITELKVKGLKPVINDNGVMLEVVDPYILSRVKDQEADLLKMFGKESKTVAEANPTIDGYAKLIELCKNYEKQYTTPQTPGGGSIFRKQVKLYANSKDLIKECGSRDAAAIRLQDAINKAVRDIEHKVNITEYDDRMKSGI